MELGHDALCHFPYFIIAQIAYAALVRMMNVLIGHKFAVGNSLPHLLVGIAERDSLKNQLVYTLHTEYRVVTFIFHYFGVYLHFAHHVCRHFQAIVQLIEHW